MIKNTDAAIQSSVFTHFFLASIVSWWLIALTVWRRWIGVFVLTILIVVQTAFTIPEVKSLQSAWPNSDRVVEFLLFNMTDDDRLLAEGEDIYTLALDNRIPAGQINGPFVFEYEGNEGLEAYVAAISNGYFRFVELEYTYFSEQEIAPIEQAMKERYTLVLQDGPIRLYELQ